MSGPEGLISELVYELARRGADFDRKQLGAILTSAGIDASEENINELNIRMKLRGIIHWAKEKTIIAGPSKELLGLHNALGKWLERCFGGNGGEPNPYVDELLSVLDKDGNDGEKQFEKFESIIWLLKATKEAADLLEAERPHTRRSGAETYLFRRLHEDYCELSGRQTLSEKGPPFRFVKECAEMIVPGIVVPEGLRQRLEYARKQK